MKYLLTQETINIPDKVEIKCKSRVLEVKGPLGTLKK